MNKRLQIPQSISFITWQLLAASDKTGNVTPHYLPIHFSVHICVFCLAEVKPLFQIKQALCYLSCNTKSFIH